MSKTCLMCGETFPDSATFCPRDGSALRATVIGDDLIGELFCERYVVTDMLGEGGMGAVYLARDVRLPQQVAIKVLRDSTNVDPTLVQRFRQEAEAASRINHDRVARVTDFGFMTDGRAYIIMEYVNGRTLKQVIDERGALSWADTASITSMVAEGLNAAHRLGIVHRDLKPENVMVVDDADGGIRVKVLDFGIAKVIEGDSAGRTAPGFVIGTPKWMSPEQLLGEALDGRSDIYALALLAFSMLTGERAFSGPSEQAEMLARLTVPPRTLREVKPDVAWPDALQALFNRTLVRDPAMRPATALAFARELAKAVEAPMMATPVQAMASVTPSSVMPNAVLPLSMTPSASTPAAVVAASATPVMSNATPFSPAASSNAATSVSEPSRNMGRLAMIGGVVAVAAIAVFVYVQRSGAGAASSDTTSVATNAGTNAARSTDGANAVVTSPPLDTAVQSATTPVLPAVPADTNVRTTPGAPTTKPNALAQNPAGSNVGSATASGRGAGGRDAGGRSGGAAATPVTPDPTSAVNASDELERLISDAEQGIGTPDDATKRAKATELIRKIEALVPKLTSNADRGWAAFYVGTSRATLGDNAKACASLQRAHSFASASRALASSSEKWLSDLSCPSPDK